MLKRGRRQFSSLLSESQILERQQLRYFKQPTTVVLGQSVESLQALLEPFCNEKFRAKQLYEAAWRGKENLSQVLQLPKALRDDLAEHRFIMGRSKVVEKRVSVDGTTKLLLSLFDELNVEAVAIPSHDGSRLTACVSSQVGCAMGCDFCATGKKKLMI